jgi:hypothetical protein
MTKNFFVKFGVTLVSVSVFAASAQADLTYWHVTIDVSSVGSDLELEFQLWDIDWVLHNTYVLVDNVKLANGGVIKSINFEDGTLDDFVVDPWNPDSVNVVPGSVDGTGNYMLQIDEDPVAWPTITWCDFSNPGATSLSFDFFFNSTGDPALGPDELVVRLLDTGANPVVAGLTGLGDVLRYNAFSEIDVSDEVAAVLIPAPGALLLGLIGTVVVGLWHRSEQRSQRL